MTRPKRAIDAVPENVYGHRRRLGWIEGHLRDDATIVEFGCGTGSMITIPLLLAGYDAYGVDLDRRSIEFGRRLLADHGLGPDRLRCADIRALPFQPETIIASEVLEHVPDPELDHVVALLHDRLPQGGQLLVTVPNGYGWFELESFLWFRLGVGRLLESMGVPDIVRRVKNRFLAPADEPAPSTLAMSPHVQRFTRRSLRSLLEEAGFDVGPIKGTVVFAGPFSNLLFGGIPALLRANVWLASRFPFLAGGYLVVCRRIDAERQVFIQ